MRRPSIILLLCALALAGCGGSSGGSGGGQTGVIDDSRGATGNVETDSTLYQAAFGVCSSAPPEQIKSDYRTTSAKPADIARDVAANLAGGNPLDEPNARAGCLAGLKAYTGG
jgi:hypothetical protein